MFKELSSRQADDAVDRGAAKLCESRFASRRRFPRESKDAANRVTSGDGSNQICIGRRARAENDDVHSAES